MPIPTYPRRFWTTEERDTLSLLFPANSSKDVGLTLNRTERAVIAQAALMGLKKNESYIAGLQKENGERLRISGAGTRIKKGTVPCNKGQKMSDELREKVKHTFFQKGQESPNTKYDGHERITVDGYVEVRVRKGKYVPKHRLLWEAQKGPIPAGHIVMFLDGNRQNITMDNLELVSRQEAVKRNSWHRYPNEVKEVIRLTNRLKKAIDEKQNRGSA